MNIAEFFKELKKKQSIDAVKLSRPELTNKDIEGFFDKVIDYFEENGAELYVDGASASNPGKAGIGVVLKIKGKTIKRTSKPIGVATNNVAEYTALIEGLKLALAEGLHKLKIYSDSELVVKQVNGDYKVKDKNLLKLYKQVKELEKQFNDIEIVHVSRENNKEADKLAKSATLF